MKTPEQIAGTAVHEWLNEYTWPFSERREFSATELADAVEGLIVAAIEADRAQRAHEDAMQKRWEVDTALTIAERIMEPMQFAADGYATGDSTYYEYIEERIIAAAGEGIQAGRAQK